MKLGDSYNLATISNILLTMFYILNWVLKKRNSSFNAIKKRMNKKPMVITSWAAHPRCPRHWKTFLISSNYLERDKNALWKFKCNYYHSQFIRLVFSKENKICEDYLWVLNYIFLFKKIDILVTFKQKITWTILQF